MPEDLVHLHVGDAVATITLDSPANRNALSTRLVDELLAQLASVARDEDVRAVVLTHTGPVFCAGADLSEVAAGGAEAGARQLLAVLAALAESSKPVLARLTGSARAGGLGLVGACDLALATAAASFAFTEVRLGLAPAVISLTTLSRLTDRAAARYYLTGDVFDAAEAARIGLLTEVAADAAALDERVAGYLDSFRKCSPQGLAETKAITARGVRAALVADGEAMAELSGRLFASDDAHEGIAAFLAKRPPHWSP